MTDKDPVGKSIRRLTSNKAIKHSFVKRPIKGKSFHAYTKKTNGVDKLVGYETTTTKWVHKDYKLN